MSPRVKLDANGSLGRTTPPRLNYSNFFKLDTRPSKKIKNNLICLSLKPKIEAEISIVNSRKTKANKEGDSYEKPKKD